MSEFIPEFILSAESSTMRPLGPGADSRRSRRHPHPPHPPHHLGFQSLAAYHNFEVPGFQSPKTKKTCKVQDPSRSRTWDSANPGSRRSLGPWHKSDCQAREVIWHCLSPHSLVLPAAAVGAQHERLQIRAAAFGDISIGSSRTNLSFR